MDHFVDRDGRLHAEAVPLEDIAREVGTPCYVYSRATLTRHWRVLDEALGSYPHAIYYSVKANSNLALLRLFADLGSGFDVVSGGELARVVRAGGDPSGIVFSGVGKSEGELREAVELGVHSIHVESSGELERLIDMVRGVGRTARVSVRVNPDIDPQTHPYIATGLATSKFGVPVPDARALYHRVAACEGLEVAGIACHIGSQLSSVGPPADALRRVLALVAELVAEGIAISEVDIGGGLGIRYRDETPPTPQQYAHTLIAIMRESGLGIPLAVEPGRVITGNAGVLLTRVEYLKEGPERRFAIVDAAMNDLMRPALYHAWQEIVAVSPRPGVTPVSYDVVGPVCESSDVLGSDRALALAPGDLLAIRSAGAYGAVMASNYNSRPRPPEVLVDGDCFHVVRRRESIADLLALESIPEWLGLTGQS